MSAVAAVDEHEKQGGEWVKGPQGGDGGTPSCGSLERYYRVVASILKACTSIITSLHYQPAKPFYIYKMLLWKQTWYPPFAYFRRLSISHSLALAHTYGPLLHVHLCSSHSLYLAVFTPSSHTNPLLLTPPKILNFTCLRGRQIVRFPNVFVKKCIFFFCFRPPRKASDLY